MQIFAKIVGLFSFIFGLLFCECQNGPFKLVFQRGKLKLVKPPAHENQRVNRHRNLRISENFAEHPLCPVPNHRIADPFARNNSEPRLRTGLFWARHIQNKGGTIRLHSIFFYIIEVFLQTHSILKSKAHSMPSFAKQYYFVTKRLRPFWRRDAMTLLPPRVLMRARKPQRRALFNFDGLYVGFMMSMLK